MRRFFLIGCCLLIWIATALLANPGDERTVRNAGLETDTESILNYFKKKVPSDPEAFLLRLQTLVKQLGDESFAIREEATEQLVSLGFAALSELEKVRNSNDFEIRWRVKTCLDKLNSEETGKLQQAMIRILAERRSTEALLPLIDFLPFAGDDIIREEIRSTLVAIAVEQESAHPILLLALEKKSKQVRMETAILLGRCGIASARMPLRKLLDDPQPSIRLGAAIGLIYLQDKEAVEPLIRLVEELTTAEIDRVEDLLLTLGGDQGPAIEMGKTSEQKKRWMEAHLNWWKKHRDSIDLAVLTRGKNDAILFEESFQQAVETIGPRYRQMRFQGIQNNPSSVKDGVLKLGGKHAQDESQRLIIQASTVLKRPTWPRHFRVIAKIGGGNDDAGTWHVGVGIGEIRVLFHPSYMGGAFRIERFKTREFLLPNQTMPWTPAANVLHEMTIDVSTTEDKVVLDIVLAEAGENGNRYRKRFEVQPEVIGEIKEISLDRGGYRGGAGLFGRLQIRR